MSNRSERSEETLRQQSSVIRISPDDNVAVALTTIEPGAEILNVIARETIPVGHKIALSEISKGAAVVKYGYPIGKASAAIPIGAWVHSHNVVSDLDSLDTLAYEPYADSTAAKPMSGLVDCLEGLPEHFNGYRRTDGRAAVRNELWMLPTVACVNTLASTLAEWGRASLPGFADAAFAFTHPYGCSQLGEDLLNTQRLLAALVKHPNVGGVLVVGLGCENNYIDSFKQALQILGGWDEQRVRFLNAQDVEDDLETGKALLCELAEIAGADKREPIPVSELVIGLKCGGSDGFSGLTANPLLGRFSDMLGVFGGSTLLSEVPEMFGAERMLLSRCQNEDVFDRALSMIAGFYEYFTSHNQPVDKNPSPGNIDGGLTTNADKSLGCTQKAGKGIIRDVLNMYQPVRQKGLSLVCGPGNDPCAVTALTAAGAHIILFTTGRGTPLGSPAPVIKVATNSDLARRKPHWIDYDAGRIIGDAAMDLCARELYRLVVEIASGKRTRSETAGDRAIAIFKDGVTV
ncbi:altronate hydrolase [Clostridia bacterium]|nr:altronate hydrolase [Clostridia bacterium]